jgi:hypothetical protein
LGWVPRWSISPASALADEQEVLTRAGVRWSDTHHPRAWWWWLVVVVVGHQHCHSNLPYSDLKQTAAWQCCVTKRASLAQRGSVLQPRTALRLPHQELDFRLACMPRPHRNLTREGFGRMVVRVLRCVFFFWHGLILTQNSNFNVRTVCVTTVPHTPRLGQRERDRGSQPAAIHQNDVQAAHASGCGVVCVRI